MDVRGVPVLVTGGSRRIGRACVLALAGAGASVVIHHGRSVEDAQRLCEQIHQQGGKAATVQADLGQSSMLSGLMHRAGQFFGPLQILVNNAAIFRPGLFADTSQDDWHEHLAVNLTAPFLLMQGFARQIPSQTPGKIINIIDQRIARPKPGHVAYTTAKSGLWTLTQMAAQEMAPWIQVNAIGPGPILPAPDQQSDSFLQVARATPMARAGKPEDIAQAMLFLLEQEYITGDIIRVDGGEHLG
jgi:NAD(P)-dependent dehydrogenase (short-subunit alcohol dehydrogenase family)